MIKEHQLESFGEYYRNGLLRDRFEHDLNLCSNCGDPIPEEDEVCESCFDEARVRANIYG